MNENEGVLELVDMLYTMISEAWGVPLGNDKCLIERDKALDLIEEIKNQLPAEIAEARRLVARRDEFVSNAKREGESIRKMAEERARKLVDEQEIVKQARARAEEMMVTAESKSQQIRRAMNEYVDETLRGAEDTVAQALDVIRRSRSRYNSAAGAQKPKNDLRDDL